MEDQHKEFCAFCMRECRVSVIKGLEICTSCTSKYSYLYSMYETCVANQLEPLGWCVKLLPASISNSIVPEEKPALFCLECSKGDVVVTSSIDKVAFLTVVSRLLTEFLCNRRKKSPAGRRVGRRKAKRSERLGD